MPEASEGWNIGDLADLILGGVSRPAPRRTPPPRQAARHAAADTPPGPRAGRAVLALVNPRQDAIAAASCYADYWANRGESVAVLWIGHSGIKLGFFDCGGRTDWSTDILQAIDGGALHDVPSMLQKRCDRVVLAVVTSAGWTDNPFIGAVTSACVIVDPAPYQLVGSYDSLKTLASGGRRHELACFAVNADSALDATRLGERFFRLGEEFLDRTIAFEGFRLADDWPSSTRVAEAFVAGGEDRAQRLRQALLDALAQQSTPCTVQSDGAAARTAAVLPRANGAPAGRAELVPSSLVAATLQEHPEHGAKPARNGQAPVSASATSSTAAHAGRPPAAAAAALPVARLLPLCTTIADEDQLESFVAGIMAEFIDGAGNSWPLRLPGDGAAHCRWVECHDGRRCVVVTTLGPAAGALEQASAWLSPAGPNDHIILLAPDISSARRRAAAGLQARTRLFELARTPDSRQPPMIVLREVTSK